SSIFDEHGEDYFRKLETDTLTDLNRYVTRTVISTGGGLPMRPENVEQLKKIGTVIYLDVEPDEVVRRLEGDRTRPLLQGDNVSQRVRKLLDVRKPVYESAADHTVHVTGRSADDITEDIMKMTGRR
ncbi:MAG: shikimate kinase, partial [Clostridiales bacterium]|nr:shikimate kinase [Clostridiales bacterium]